MATDTVSSFRINKELWREFRAYAIKHGITTKELLEFLITTELREKRAVKGCC